MNKFCTLTNFQIKSINGINMISGVGVDIIEVSRIEDTLSNFSEKFKERIYTSGEIAYCESAKFPPQNYASHFAAKEAVMKVLEIGAGYFAGYNNGVPYKEIEIMHLPSGAPRIVLHGKAKGVAEKKGLENILISLSTLKEYSIAYAIGEKY